MAGPYYNLDFISTYGASDVYLHIQYRRFTSFSMEYETKTGTNYSMDNRDNTTNHINMPSIKCKLLPENTECIITYMIIDENTGYWECDTCNKITCWDAALFWINSHKNCPHCRCDANISTKYINAIGPNYKKSEKQKKQKKHHITANYNINNRNTKCVDNNSNRHNQSRQYQQHIKSAIKNKHK